MSRPRKYQQELIERGVRLALESQRPIARVAADLGIHSETLRKRVRQAEADSAASGPICLSTEEREEVRRLRKENFELRRSNEILSAIVESVDTYISRIETGRAQPSFRLTLAVVHRLNTNPDELIRRHRLSPALTSDPRDPRPCSGGYAVAQGQRAREPALVHTPIHCRAAI